MTLTDANHAILVGQIAGMLKVDDVCLTIVDIVVDADSNYTNVIHVERPSGVYRITVEKIDDEDQDGAS